VASVVEAVLLRGGQIVHGSHPTYVPLIEAVAQNLYSCDDPTARKPVKMFVVGPYVDLKEAEQLKLEHGRYADIEWVGPLDRSELAEKERSELRFLWLQVMRARMSAYSDALVCIGGRGVRPDVPIPGVLAEAAMASQHGKPVYLAAAFGGFAQYVHKQRVLPETDWAKNGLDSVENEILISAADPSRVTELVLTGLVRVYGARCLAPSGGVRGNRDSHLAMIQGVINRMGQNSFSLKGWAVTVAAGLFALAAATDVNPWSCAAALLAVLTFWFLDAFYLRQERMFRALFDQVRRDLSGETDYEMDTSRLVSLDKKRLSHWNCFWSRTEAGFYLPVFCVVLLIFLALMVTMPTAKPASEVRLAPAQDAHQEKPTVAVRSH
jgi:hypothetical protein